MFRLPITIVICRNQSPQAKQWKIIGPFSFNKDIFGLLTLLVISVASK